ncbi:phosphatase [Chryseolinea lacunae]|uniref:Phosphatase n=1 Tax=Chryseolinea lacunae TaxID=2801331 RepID=A0ABS1KM91_9BACT|nr:phosphatase [Chryseolinea lacunae]MBL0740338.1 phosphatase [Chryseolinea lacunae]
MSLSSIEKIFSTPGGQFVTPIEELSKKLKNIKAFVFDWDGVFNDGTKNEHGSSTFSETDAMGTNLMRLSRWMPEQKMPYAAVLSGEENKISFKFGAREHFHHVYFKVRDKTIALSHFNKTFGLTNENILFVFDDVLDLSLARICGLRMMISRKANPMFRKYVIDNGLADYITAHDGSQFGVREITELVIALSGNYDETLEHRITFSPDYKTYFEERQNLPTSFFTVVNNEIARQEIVL